MLGAAMLPRYLRSPTADADSAFLCRAEGVQALEVIEDVTDFEGPMDANMTETDFEGGASTEGGETGTRVPKKYDSDDDDEPQRLARKKKAKNVAKG
eukprot:1598850-Rhodomonas_salina.3